MARTPRKRYLRHGDYDRTSRSKRLRAFLADRATELSGTGANTSLTVSAGVITATAHGFALGDGPFLFVADTDAVPPTPLDEVTLYWIASVPDANTFTLTSHRGGDPITLTDDGSARRWAFGAEGRGRRGHLRVPPAERTRSRAGRHRRRPAVRRNP